MRPHTLPALALPGRLWLPAGVLGLLFLLSIPAEAQNTKGDKPVSSQSGQFIRIPRFKSNSNRRGDRAYTRDISGRKRIRTKNTSSANRVIYQAPSPYKQKHYRRHDDRPGVARGRVYNKPQVGHDVAYKGARDGSKLRVRSISGRMARSNVYPQNGPYVNNKSSVSKKTRVYTRTARGKRIYRSKPPSNERAFAGGANYSSISAPWIKRGRKNVYWGKYSKGERAITRDLTGRPVRMKNFHSGTGGLASDTLKLPVRRPRGDRAGVAGGGYVSASQYGERAWKGDVSGHKIRRRPPRKGDRSGLLFEAPYHGLSGRGERAGKKLHGGGYKTSKPNKGLSGPLPPRQPGMGAGGIARAMKRTKGQPHVIGGGAAGIGGYKGNIRRSDLASGFSRAGGNYRGNVRSKRPPKGGGSVSGQHFNNNGQPIEVRGPGIGSQGIGKFRGTFRRGDLSPGFSHAGGDYSGNIRARRRPKGGGSVSGQHFNNNGQPIEVRGPGIGSQGIGKFRGTFRRGDLSPGFSHAGGDYRGSIRAKKPMKGGGSISGRHWNNEGQPIDVRGPGIGSRGIGKYQGTLKGRRPLRGGGSVSGRHWNNDGQPLQVRGGAPGFDKAASFKGSQLKADIQPGFERQGYGYSGSIRAKKPKHGGGSISDRPMNNDGEPIPVRIPLSPAANKMNYEGKIRLPFSLWNYVQNPNANDKSLKKRKPSSNIYRFGDLQVIARQGKYEKKPHAADGSMRGHPPGQGSVNAAAYDRGVRRTWRYTHNPSSHDLAMKVIAPGKGTARAAEYDHAVRRVWRYTHNPSSNDQALKVIAPGKAYARINDFQGNTRMLKYRDSRLHPDAQFSHGFRDNTKEDRTIIMNIKLFWAKLFRKNDLQPQAVKEKERRPRYDKKEKDLWKALYD